MLDHTGLTFSDEETKQNLHSFYVTGFRDEDHVDQWRKEYYNALWGYGPRFTRADTPEGIRLHVYQSTSCD